MTTTRQPLAPTDESDSTRSEVVAGLSSNPKRLSSKFFYDARGSQLFGRICEQPEYYLTRTELDIMRQHGPAMGWALGEWVRLVEFGSGSGAKTRLLLRNVASPAAYIPVDISASALQESVALLRQEIPGLAVMPLVADFTQRLTLPAAPEQSRRTVVYFPGSTLGNFDQQEALTLLRNIRSEVGHRGGALIGIDLKKDVAEMEAAYNDKAGITAAFTLNMLTHLNRDIGTDFDERLFKHRARYDAANSRIETNIVSVAEQVVKLAGSSFHFAAGESMLVEYSHKYTLEEFGQMALRSGLRIANYWTDAEKRFAIVFITANPGPTEPSTPLW